MTKLDFKLRILDNGIIKLAAFLGVSDAAVRNWKDNKTQPRLDVALKISEFTDIPVAELFDEVDENGQKVETDKLAQVA